MKIKEAIRRTDLAKPNAFEEELKFLWLTALEGQIAADVFLMAPARRSSSTTPIRTDWTWSCW